MMRNNRLELRKDIALRKKAIRLNIPTYIRHNGEEFILDGIKRQRNEALQIGKKLQKNKIRFRIKFFGNKFGIYGERNEKKKKINKK
jgi:hypothetical protein